MNSYYFNFVRTLTLANVLFIVSLAQSAVPSCPDRLVGFENIQIQQLLSQDGKNCYLSIHPRDAYETFVYRDYLISHTGYMMIFNSYSAGKSLSASDGAREYFFLPAPSPGFSWSLDQNGNLVIEGFAGRTLHFSLQTAQLVSISGAQIKLADQVLPGNRGGLEIIENDFLYLDAGFKFGDSPSSNQKAISRVINSKRQVCSLRNNQVYQYLNDSVFLKPIKDLEKKIKASCANFDTSGIP